MTMFVAKTRRSDGSSTSTVLIHFFLVYGRQGCFEMSSCFLFRLFCTVIIVYALNFLLIFQLKYLVCCCIYACQILCINDLDLDPSRR